MSVLEIDAPAVRHKLAEFIRTQMSGAGFQRAIIGISGGLDSTVTTYLTAEALGPENVIGLMMPYGAINPQCLEHAQVVAQELGIASEVIDITPQIDAYFARFPEADRLRRANKMARERMSVLYDYSRIHQALVVGASNKSERLLGYTTIWGDMACAFAPLGGLYKTQVRQLARELGVPDVICTKPPSAGLWPGQTDEGELGFTYADADQILYWLIDQHLDPPQVAEKGWALELVNKIAAVVEGSTYKRKMPPVPQS